MKMTTNAWLLRLAAMALSWGSAAQAQHQHGEPKAMPQGMAASAPASAAKPARKPKSQLGMGTAFAPDGSLWWVGLNADGQMVIQSAALLPASPVQGAVRPLPLQWSVPRVFDIGGDPVAAAGETQPQPLV